MFSQSRRAALSRGTHQAVAETLSEAFGLEADDLDGLDDTPEQALANAEVELMLYDEDIEPAMEDLFLDLDADDDTFGAYYGDDDDDEDDEDDDDEDDDDDDDDEEDLRGPKPPSVGRVGVSAKAREEYGLFKAIGRFAKGVGRGIGKGLTSGAELASQFDQAYSQAQAQLPPPGYSPTYTPPSAYMMAPVMPAYPQASSPAVMAPMVSSQAPVPAVPMGVPQVAPMTPPSPSAKAPSVEAGPESLPPVYVADPVTADQIGVHTNPQALKTETTFGAAADQGIVGCQSRPRAKKAAQNAVFRGSQAMASAPFRPPQAMVEDVSSKPHLLSDGRVVDSVHGELSTLPCPSCSRVNRKAVFGGTAHNCPVCDDFGAILIPDGDVPSYAGCSSYGFVQFLIEPVSKHLAAHQHQSKAAESASMQQHKASVHARLMKKLQEQRAASETSSSVAPTPGAPVPAPLSSSSTLAEDDEGMEDVDVFGALGSAFDGLEEDLEDDFGIDDLLGADDDFEDEDEFGIDEWADSIYGADDLDGIDDEDYDDLDDDDVDDFDAALPNYGLARAMIPATGGW